MTTPAPATLAALAGRLRGTLRIDEPLAAYTTYRIGGPAAALVTPAVVDDVVLCIQAAAECGCPWLAIGLGSNLLVHDRGFPGIVIRLGRPLDAVRQEATGRWRVGAGLPTPRLARQTAIAGWAGLHRLVGVPGTVGGGAAMNAGAHGQEFRDVVRSIEVVRADGEVEERDGSDIPWAYRTSGLREEVVTAVTVALTAEDPQQLETELKQHLRWRKAGTPFNEPCCGSVFRNPAQPVSADPGRTEGPMLRTAGQLIDAAGLKGLRIGGATVSPVHANYIVNAGGATAADVHAVIDEVRRRVLDRFGVSLALEVRLIGAFAEGAEP